METMLEKKVKTAIGKTKAKIAGGVSLVFDWGALIPILLEALIPLLQNCFNKQNAVMRMQNMRPRDRAALSIAVRRRIREDRDCVVCFGIRQHVREIVEGLEETATESSPEELAEVYSDAVS